jgi:hypothetical protein
MGLNSCANPGWGSVMVMPSRMMAGIKPKCTTGCTYKHDTLNAAQSHALMTAFASCCKSFHAAHQANRHSIAAFIRSLALPYAQSMSVYAFAFRHKSSLSNSIGIVQHGHQQTLVEFQS